MNCCCCLFFSPPSDVRLSAHTPSFCKLYYRCSAITWELFFFFFWFLFQVGRRININLLRLQTQTTGCLQRIHSFRIKYIIRSTEIVFKRVLPGGRRHSWTHNSFSFILRSMIFFKFFFFYIGFLITGVFDYSDFYGRKFLNKWLLIEKNCTFVSIRILTTRHPKSCTGYFKYVLGFTLGRI